jgi:hypothetical protein
MRCAWLPSASCHSVSATLDATWILQGLLCNCYIVTGLTFCRPALCKETCAVRLYKAIGLVVCFYSQCAACLSAGPSLHVGAAEYLTLSGSWPSSAGSRNLVHWGQVRGQMVWSSPSQYVVT